MSVYRVSSIDKGEIFTDSSGKTTLTYRIIVSCSSLDDSVMALRAGLPQYQKWQAHWSEPGFFVDTFRPIQRQHTGNWEVQVDYIDTIVKDPTTLPAVIGEIKTFTVPGATITDYRDNPILNTAGEPPEPFDFPEQVICFPISKNVSGLPTWLFDFESCINADAVRIGATSCAPLTLMIRNITLSAEQEQGDITYRTATLEVWRRKSTWLELWPSRGYNQLVTIPKGAMIPGGIAKKKTTVLRPIVLDNGEKPTEPQFLDANGKWLQDPTPSQLNIIKTQLYPSISFTNYFPLH